MTTELHSTYWLDLYADESDSFQNVKDEYISSTSWHRALQIPDSSVTMDDKNHLFAEVLSQKDSSVSHVVWNPGSEFSFCACSWSMQRNLCKHVIIVQILDEIQKLVELSFSNDISSAVNKLPLKWGSGKGRTSFRKPSSIMAVPSVPNTVRKAMRRNRKRKRLSRPR